MSNYVPEPVGSFSLEWIIRELNRISPAIEDANIYYPIRTITDATYTIVNTDSLVLVDATSAAATITLPKTVKERVLTVKKIDNVNTVTIDTTGSETIDGSATKVLSTQYDSLTMACDGSDWWIR